LGDSRITCASRVGEVESTTGKWLGVSALSKPKLRRDNENLFAILPFQKYTTLDNIYMAW
jgi:hypothetical protein